MKSLFVHWKIRYPTRHLCLNYGKKLGRFIEGVDASTVFLLLIFTCLTVTILSYFDIYMQIYTPTLSYLNCWLSFKFKYHYKWMQFLKNTITMPSYDLLTFNCVGECAINWTNLPPFLASIFYQYSIIIHVHKFVNSRIMNTYLLLFGLVG
jgi:hypothetical protein